MICLWLNILRAGLVLCTATTWHKVSKGALVAQTWVLWLDFDRWLGQITFIDGGEMSSWGLWHLSSLMFRN